MNCIFNISLHFVTLCRLRAWKKSDAEQDSAVSCSDNSLPSGYIYTVEDSKVFKLSNSFFSGFLYVTAKVAYITQCDDLPS